MSDNILGDSNIISGLPMKDGSSCNVLLTKPSTENGDSKLEEWKNMDSPTTGLNLDCKIGVEAGNTEVEYIESENLNDVEDLDFARQNLLSALDSKDWVTTCGALNNVRRLSLFHKEILLEMLRDVIPLIVKSLKNPRSALCKTAIMTSSDIFKAYGDLVVDSLDPLLVQLLLKSAQDKRFVCEAAQAALIAMTASLSPALLLPKLQPNLKHKNPKIRAKASMCFCKSVPQLRSGKGKRQILELAAHFETVCRPLNGYNHCKPYEGVEGIRDYGIDILVQVAASQLSDRLPESRESARSLLSELRTVYENSVVQPSSDSEQSDIISWEGFCQSKLSPLSAQAVLRVTSVARDGSVL